MLKRVKKQAFQKRKSGTSRAPSPTHTAKCFVKFAENKNPPKRGRLCHKEIDYRKDNYYTNLYLYKFYFPVGVDSALMFNAFTAEFI